MASSALLPEFCYETYKEKSTNLSAEPFVIGGDDPWHYLPQTQQFDLSRASPIKLVINTNDDSTNHRGIVIDPSKTCLIIVDMQNYFVNPSFHHHPGGLNAVDPIRNLIAKCRQSGIQVAWLNWVITEHDLRIMPPAVQRSFAAHRIQERGHGWGVNLGSPLPNGERVLFEGSWNADLYAPLKAVVAEDDIFCTKNRMSGLWRADEPLHQYLQASGKKTLMFTGINTDQCLLSTLTDAHSWGWDCILISDAAGTATGRGAEALVEYNVATCMGFCASSKDVVQAKLISSLIRHDSMPDGESDDSGIEC